MGTISEDVVRSLVEHGNAVLLLPTPRWEKQIAAHVHAFWLDALLPMIRVATVVELSVPSRTRSLCEEVKRAECLDSPDSEDFCAKWLDAIKSGDVGESNIFLGLCAEDVYSSAVFRKASSVGYFDSVRKKFSSRAQAAIAKCLSESELAFGIGPPPFGSCYIFSRLS